MERFAFKIDNVLRANLYKICRLCGIDNPDKVPILRENEEEVFDVDAEPELSQKIQDCIGFLISKDDKMPQMICSLCVDKINDFYEFREMCYDTNIQTRKLLGLKDLPKKDLEVKVEVKTETSPMKKMEKRARKRKSDEINFETEIKIENEKAKAAFNPNLSKKKVRLNYVKQKNQFADSENFKMEFKNEPNIKLDNITEIDNLKLKQLCKICKQRFGSKYKLDRHKFLEHTPNIPRFVCTTCDETLKMNGEIKNHQLWHKLTKTPYTCALCLETMSSVNLYTRHLRDHAQKFATPLVVLDRECALCHKTFCTNFLYNTHPCAVRTQKCGGCDRQIKNDMEYLRHASICQKAYHMVSKHLSAALEPVQIKNENEVEAAAESLNMGVSVPISDMTQNDHDINLKSSADALLNKATKKSGKKGISKKDLKRVDDLLKLTMDALVSIKHEPEMHVDPDIPNIAEHQDKYSARQVGSFTPNAFDNDDFHNGDDDSEDEDAGPFVPIVQLQTGSEVIIKQEPLDSQNTDMINVNVKKELPDSGYEDSSATGAVAKIPVLKLKITKEHGTLNSSLVDESSNCREKKKKKKKHKDIDKVNDQDDNETSQDNPLDSTKSKEFSSMPQPGIIRIKQECIDDDYLEDSLAPETHGPAFNNSTMESVQPEATVMTSIPMMQLQISCISSGVEFKETNTEREEAQDIKPNRAELDRWLQSTTTPTSEANFVEMNNTSESNYSSTPIPQQNQHVKKTQLRSKAFKSTGGVSHQNNTNLEFPKIVSVTSGFDPIASDKKESGDSSFIFSNVSVKVEPCDEGYENVPYTQDQMNSDNEYKSSLRFQDHYQIKLNNNIRNDEQAYINSIDFNNISIKQEKDIDVSESQLTAQQISTHSYNGKEDVSMESMPDVNEFGHVGNIKTTNRAINVTEDEEEVDGDEKNMELEEEDISKREYRELEWPPPLAELKSDEAVKSSEVLGLVIANVSCQVNEQFDKNHESGEITFSGNHLPNNKESNKNSGSEQSKFRTTSTPNSVFLHSNTLNVLEKTPSSSTEAIEISKKSTLIPVKADSNKSRAKDTNSSNYRNEKVSKGLTNSLDVGKNFKTTDNQLTQTKESAVETVSLKFEENENRLLKTTPETTINSIENENVETTPFTQHIDEEQQNILNHEVLANSETEANNGISQVPLLDQVTARQFDSSGCHGNCIQPSLSSEQSFQEKSTSSPMLTEYNEETDNFFNENVDAVDRRQHQEQEALHCISSSFNLSQQRTLVIDNSNINEIAENNNNANIERELLDENSNNTGRLSPSSTINRETNGDEVT